MYILRQSTMKRNRRKPKQVRPLMGQDEIRRVMALLEKFPEMTTTSIIKRAIRELAEKEQVA